jgi:soluble lytic murein transglycosylase
MRVWDSNMKKVVFASWLLVLGSWSVAYAEAPEADVGQAEIEEAEVAEAEVTVPRSLPDQDGVELDAEAAAPEATVDDTDAGVEAGVEQPSPAEQPAPAEQRPADSEGADIPSSGSDADENWRIPPSDKPPVQVRRAADRVEQTAASMARALSDVDETDVDVAEAAEAANEDATAEARPRTRRLTRDANHLERLREAIDFGKVRHVAGEILTSGGSAKLVLTPYVDDPRWAEAMELLAEDECDEALELAGELLGPAEAHRHGEPAIRYALARIQMCSSDQRSEGRATLEELAEGDLGAVSELARRRLGRGGKPTGEGLSRDERIAQAKHLAAAGEVDEALADLDVLYEVQTRGWHRYQIRSAQIDILQSAGRLDEATRRMLGLYRYTRDWTIGDRVEKRLEALQKRSGVEVLTFGERVDRMRDLIARGRYSRARKVSVDNAKLAGVSGDELEGWGLYRRALQAERQRKRERAAELFEQAEELVEDDTIRPRLYFGWARALRRIDRDTEAIALYERLCEEYPSHLLCPDATFEAGRLSQYLEMHHKARQKFAAVVGMYPDSDKVPKALWRGAFSAYMMGDFEAAQAPLEHIIAHYPDLQDASELTMGLKAQYWLATAKLKAGQDADAIDAYHETMRRGPLTWYGRLAATRLAELGEQPRPVVPRSTLSARELENLSTLRVPRNERLEVAAELSRLGLYADAIEELRKQVSIYPIPEHAHEFLAAVYLSDGQPNYAHWIMKSHIDESGPGYHNLREWGVAFPINYMELSHKYGEKYEVSPFLVQAIIRQESGFRTGVASPVGALGLMQLMPGTARRTHREFLGQGGRLSRTHIVQPETNVRLGTMTIRMHTAHASESLALALAGYNAGPLPVESWFERYGDREIDAWVESITYRETRGYVRKVFTSYVTYAGLYGDGTLPTVNLEMPEALRKYGDVPEVEKVEEGEPVGWLGR